MKITKTVLPNTVTALNLFSGFVSIILASQGEYLIASFLIIAAAIFDAVDGLLARALKVSSKFGVELDSLADVVSFGAAPSFLAYAIDLNNYGILGIVVASLPLIFGAFRLAKFNVGIDDDLKKKSDFSGLPIPMSAMVISSFVISLSDNGVIHPPFDVLLIPIVIIVSVLMVSSIKYNKMPRFSISGFKESKEYFLIILLGIVLIIFTQLLALFIIFSLIVVIGIVRDLFTRLTTKS